MHKKRVLRVMREHPLLVKPNVQLRAQRTPSRRKPRPTHPNEGWGLDMTKVLGEGFGWVDIVLVLDWYTQKIVGHYAGMPYTARSWLAALDMAVNGQLPNGAQGKGGALMSDNGCQPTAMAFMQACNTLGIPQTFTRDNNPKGQADTARMKRTLKEECLWLQEWTNPVELSRACEAWIAYDNDHDLHSSLGYTTPRPFEMASYHSHSTPFVAA